MFENDGTAGPRPGKRQRRGAARAPRRAASRRVEVLLLTVVAIGCEPDLIIGTWSDPSMPVAGAGGSVTPGGASGAGATGAVGGVAGAVAGGTGGDAAGSGGTAGGAGTAAAGAAGSPDSAGGAGGEPACDAQFVTEGGEGGAPTGPVLTPVTVPWTTSFENEFCEYAQARGFCYLAGDASFESVSSPVRSGEKAAAFFASSATRPSHARCVRQGVFPTDAWYGAWFYVPAPVESIGNWNLMYVNGAVADEELHGLWDVSIATTEAGGLVLYIFDQLRGTRIDPPDAPEVPVGEWFHVEFRLLRAPDETGLIALRQDGELILEVPQILTDDSVWSQWYVGNLVNGHTPPDSTVYVDDVSLRVAR